MSDPGAWRVGNVTGQQLAAALQAHAEQQGTTVNRLAPALRLVEIARAARPKAVTIEHVRAILRGEPLPPRRSYQFQPGYHLAERGPGGPVPEPIDRDPCPMCGIRGDIGCKHRSVDHAR